MMVWIVIGVELGPFVGDDVAVGVNNDGRKPGDD
jgi:hypothetical protein